MGWYMSNFNKMKGLLKGEIPKQVLRYANSYLKAAKEELLDALEGELTDYHGFVLNQTLQPIEALERSLRVFFQAATQMFGTTSRVFCRHCRPCQALISAEVCLLGRGLSSK